MLIINLLPSIALENALKEGKRQEARGKKQRNILEVVKALFEENEQAIGEYIKVRGTEFKIVGIMKSNRRGEDAVEQSW